MTNAEIRARGTNWVSMLSAVVLLVSLLVSRREHWARGQRGNVRAGVLALVGGYAVAAGFGWGLITLADQSTTSGGARLGYAIVRLFTLSQSAVVSDVRVARWVDVVVNLTGLPAFLLVLYMIFRAPKGREPLTGDDETRLRALLAKHGERDSLGYFALRRDKAAMWSPSGKELVVLVVWRW